ncbi:sulfite exporter TauE/SafE family protein [Dyella solisilvae]|uniref:Probable membrane transporter protein n=1 Tax=Dyella solisilvae TaxID=1920168 RepID=A0A370KAA9_9GAMM|nr:sulfite exporter TauE/SafE family protein [Dyella solisilvae]RDI99581.1 sulfite exporter TauE/SafE family protein [Dyella solisilvae]
MPTDFLASALVGALAQLVDGALGMAYGVTSAALLLALGVPPALASASVHYAETFTCGASGFSHLLAGNVLKKLFWSLVIPGAVGATLGAYVVTHLPAGAMKMVLTPYLIGMGLFLLLRPTRRQHLHDETPRITGPLGLVAGFADAVAGGGWSALNVTTLVARGVRPRMVIGTVHLAKCLVSAVASITFFLQVGLPHSGSVLGLIAGGVVAAPFSALLARRMPPRVATVLAALAVLAIGLNNVAHLIFTH